MSNHQPNPETPGPSDANAAPQTDADFQIANLIQERDDAVSKYQRSMADYQNYHRRSLENEREAKRQGITSVLQSIIPILDHFDLALGHKTDNAADSQVIEGVKVIRDELIKALASHGVTVINPQPNDELDPQKHQVILNQPSPNVEPGRISMTLQVGYTLESRVIRPAKVAVAPSV